MSVNRGPDVGAKAPDFSLPKDMNSTLCLSELARSKPVLLIFYPSDFGMMCSIELKTFQNRSAEFAPHCHLVGVSTNSTRSQGDFSLGLGLDFPLVSDLDGKVSKAWGVLCENGDFMDGRAYRSVFLVDEKMTVRFKWIPDDPSYEPDYDQLLAEVRKVRD
jgi:thioredoxin-dependent peroxiredoxin